MSTIDPAGPSASRVANLWWWMLGGSALLCTLVFTLLLVALFRRGVADRETPARKRVWIGWLGVVMPVAVLMVLLGFALWVGERNLPTDRAAQVVQVTAYNYGWEFCYENGSCSEGVLRIPARQSVDLDITATDVIHSLWIPRLAGKMDAIPGQINRLRIQADRPGQYEAVCAEYCGVGHVYHRFVVEAYDTGETDYAVEAAR
ncbi:cytochrome c oxidase subunit II [Croceicoccus marinus]|uniref:cytochrome c oxidase subunit II n=1 Tax=Croceicoccus marinus TaxID=450378 RepID=UPI001FD1E082|nr:cytochrome c oxidase subunit II [Croceicoccus marinus]